MLIIVLMIIFFIWAGFRGICFRIEDYNKKQTSKRYDEWLEEMERKEQEKKERIAAAQPPIYWEDLCVDPHNDPEDWYDYFE